MTLNPLPKMTQQGDKPVITGMFPATLTGIETFEGSTYEDPDVKEQKIVFKFDVKTEDCIVEIGRICSIKYGEKSNLSKVVKELTGSGYSREAVFQNEDTVWDHIQTLITRRYTLMCEPSEGGTYTKVKAISPVKSGKSEKVPDNERQPMMRDISQPMPPKKESSGGVTFNDDDIPF